MRPDTLTGRTYQATLDDLRPMFVTVNSLDGRPYEVFVRIDDPHLFEWVVALTLMITRALRAGESLEAIATELMEIHSPATRHFIKGGIECPSLSARIGMMLMRYVEDGA